MENAENITRLKYEQDRVSYFEILNPEPSPTQSRLPQTDGNGLGIS